MHQDCPDTGNLRRLRDAKHSISEKGCTDTVALKFGRDCQSSQNDNRHWIGHIPSNPARSFGVSNRSCCKSVVSGKLLSRPQHIRARRASLFVLKRTPLEPAIESWLAAFKLRHIVRCSQFLWSRE